MRNNLLFDEHTLDIVKAAFPHVDHQTQSGMNLLLKASDLVSSVQDIQNAGELSAMGIQEEGEEVNHTDPEALLLSIKEVCNMRENEMVDMCLNVVKAQKIYGAYRNHGPSILHTEEVDSAQGNSQNPFSFNARGSLMEMLMSTLSPDQRNTFEMINMMMSTMPHDMNMGNMGNMANMANMANMMGSMMGSMGNMNSGRTDFQAEAVM